MPISFPRLLRNSRYLLVETFAGRNLLIFLTFAKVKNLIVLLRSPRNIASKSRKIVQIRMKIRKFCLSFRRSQKLIPAKVFTKTSNDPFPLCAYRVPLSPLTVFYFHISGCCMVSFDVIFGRIIKIFIKDKHWNIIVKGGDTSFFDLLRSLSQIRFIPWWWPQLHTQPFPYYRNTLISYSVHTSVWEICST